MHNDLSIANEMSHELSHGMHLRHCLKDQAVSFGTSPAVRKQAVKFAVQLNAKISSCWPLASRCQLVHTNGHKD